MITSKLKIFFIIILLIVPMFSGCTQLEDAMNFFDPVLRRAEPYISKVKFDDPNLRDEALRIIQEANATDKEGYITAIYRYIVENYQYISDPEDEELIRSPKQTMNIHGGDCEDLSILLMSLLENIGIKTYLVLTEKHAYALAYDVDINNLWKKVETTLIQQVEKDSGEAITQTFKDTITLKGKQIWYYGGEGNLLADSESFDYINITYDVESPRSIDFYVVSAKQDFHDYSADKPFNHFEDHSYEGVKEIQGTCGYMPTYGGVILSNPTWVKTEVSIDLVFYSHPSFYKLFKNKTIQSYQINNKQCIVLEPTAGDYGYPGFDANVTGEKTAIDPITKEYFYLL